MNELKDIDIVKFNTEFMLILKKDEIEDIKDIDYKNNTIYIKTKNKRLILNLKKILKEEETISISKIYITDNHKFIIDKENAEAIIIEL